METLVIEDAGVTADEVIDVARRHRPVSLGPRALAALERGSRLIAEFVDSDEPVYGVTTGFGALANTIIPPERSAELQVNLLRSHAAGMGDEVDTEVIRAMMLLRARSLAMGYSGARAEVAEAILALLNAGLTPVVREYGSLGASGDLAPLASAALPLIGEGSVRGRDGVLHEASEALAAAGLSALELTAKEGLALINGTDGMLGMLVLALADLSHLATVADVAGAISTEALMGTDRAFAADLIALRPQLGQAASAENLRRLLAESDIVASHRHGDDRVQDAYSIRCTPQVHGALRDAIAHASSIADRELVAFIDNPVVLAEEGRVESCGNFHGAPLAQAADFLAIAAADIGALSERRTDRMLDPKRSYGLPPFLTDDAGVNSGLMIAQYTQAAMVTETRRLAVPASVDTIPTSAMQEDHVSLGWGACRKLRAATANLTRILAIELACGARALEFRSPLQPAAATAAVAAAVRRVTGPAGPDTWLSPRLEAVADEIKAGVILETVAAEIGELL